MRKICIALLFSFLAYNFQVRAQDKQVVNFQQFGLEKQPLSAYDSMMLSQLPPLRMQESALRRSLPYMVDNSELPYFRPLVAQVGLECGQASSIGVVFTYEINAARGVPGNTTDNQYTTHFTYNFINGGSDAGVNYYETYEIVKRAGNPSVSDYGGMSTGGPSRWMSGYENYYNSMKNRINDVYSIKTNTAEGIQTLKNWIYDHGKGDEAGGLGAFYAQFGSPNATLPAGTPEAGKYVFTQFGNSANHAMSIVGYNDSIRYDYNGDGQYTNHLDINNDGIVDVRDWEIGGFKMANTYGNVNWWGDNGFAYMMYKTLADKFGQGGIWNNLVAVVEVRDYHEPLLTAKLSITYGCRNKLKVTVGYADDPSASEPDVILHFPIFDFQGGCYPMQGNGASETIEFGLDLNYLLAYATPNQNGKYFLMVHENDPGSQNSGTINSFSLMSYVDGDVEEFSYGSSMPIENNTITVAEITAAIDFDPVNIVQETLPGIQLNQPYSVELEAEGGTSPYRWHLMDDYELTDSTATMPNVSFQQLSPSNNNNGLAEVQLPFQFPFYGTKYNKLYVTVDGYIRFDNSLIPWPFYIDGKTYFLQNKMIAPCMSHPFVVAPSEGDGVWFEATTNYVSFRWKLSVSGSTSSTTINMVARLHKNGKIEFFHGEHNVQSYVRRYGGISAGDGENFVNLNPDGIYMPLESEYIRFDPLTNYTGLSLSESGLLSGTVNGFLQNEPIKIGVTDKNNVRQFRTYLLNSEGVIVNAEVQPENGEVITFGDHFSLNVEINNINPFTLNNITLSLTSNGAYFEVLENQHFIPLINEWTTDTLWNIFDVLVSADVPDGTNGRFSLLLESDEGSWSRNFSFTAHAPVMEVTSLVLNDGNNGLLEPGETAWIEIMLHNAGGAPLMDVSAELSSSNPYLEILSSTLEQDTLAVDGNWLLEFEVLLNEQTPLLEIVDISLSVWGHHDFSFYKTYPILTSLIVEDFETGDFSSFDWEMAGNVPWFITNENAFEGNYAARSGMIDDDQASILLLHYDVAYGDSISFYYKVSSETDYDFLKFFINGIEKGSWSGEIDWAQAGYEVSTGNNLFVWRYEKDYSVAGGSDAVWIDFIILPAFAIPTGQAEISDEQAHAMHVYPNPFSGQLTVEVELQQSSVIKLLLVDGAGRIIYAEESSGPLAAGKHSFSPLTGQLSAGVYYLLLQTNQGSLVKKIIRPSF